MPSTLDAMTSQERKDRPVFSGVLNYFPDAIAYVAMISKIGNDKHNPGQPLHWSRDKSSDHKDCCARHLIDAGHFDPDGIRHSGYLAWRALANLQIELEEAAKPKDVIKIPETAYFTLKDIVVGEK